MRDYKEEDFLLLSGIQHFKFCKRQWALIHIEHQWNENFLTASGSMIHENVHNPDFREKRNNIIISRSMPVYSYELGVSGECDAVEFILDENGIPLKGRKGKYKICPVEYKRGRPKESDEDIFQLVAQAICLENMFCTKIEKGYLYYYATRHRQEVIINDELRTDVQETFTEMHNLFDRKYTPKVKPTSKCKSCSLKDICLSQICRNISALDYIKETVEEREAK